MEWAPQDENRILFCPNCGYNPRENDYLNLHSSREVHSLSLEPAQETFLCTQCNYSGQLFSIPESDRYKMEFDIDALDAPIKHAQKGGKRFYLYAIGFILIIGAILQTSSLFVPVVLTILLAALIIYLELRARTLS